VKQWARTIANTASSVGKTELSQALNHETMGWMCVFLYYTLLPHAPSLAHTDVLESLRVRLLRLPHAVVWAQMDAGGEKVRSFLGEDHLWLIATMCDTFQWQPRLLGKKQKKRKEWDEESSSSSSSPEKRSMT
jgi:hypothetical protein